MSDKLLIRTGADKDDIHFDNRLVSNIKANENYEGLIIADSKKGDGLGIHHTSTDTPVLYANIKNELPVLYNDKEHDNELEIANKSYVKSAIETASSEYMPVNGEELLDQAVTITSKNSTTNVGGGIHIESDNVALTQGADGGGITVENGVTNIKGSDNQINIGDSNVKTYITINSQDISIHGYNITFNRNRVHGVANPTSNYDAVNLYTLNSRIKPVTEDISFDLTGSISKKTSTLQLAGMSQVKLSTTVEHADFKGVIFYSVNLFSTTKSLAGDYLGLGGIFEIAIESQPDHSQFRGHISSLNIPALDSENKQAEYIIPVICNNYNGNVSLLITGWLNEPDLYDADTFSFLAQIKPLFMIPLTSVLPTSE